MLSSRFTNRVNQDFVKMKYIAINVSHSCVSKAPYLMFRLFRMAASGRLEGILRGAGFKVCRPLQNALRRRPGTA